MLADIIEGECQYTNTNTASTHFKSSGEFRHASDEESEEDCLTDVTSS